LAVATAAADPAAKSTALSEQFTRKRLLLQALFVRLESAFGSFERC
jgi:hypothetical protein